VLLRTGGPADVGPALDLWQRAYLARHAKGHTDTDVTDADVTGLDDKLADPTACFLVGEDEATGEVIASAAGFRARTDMGLGEVILGLAHISLVATVPARWGTGLGGQIMAELLDRLMRAGHDRAQLFTHESNRRAQALYLGLGFQPEPDTQVDPHGELIRLWRLDLGAGRGR
jgi:ribosomal protein S18 acetylase RimI-like enzyme